MQLTLFNSPQSIPPIDPHVELIEAPRLRGQNAAILERLQSGPATNRELAGLSLKYTSRVSDLRAAGYRIECERDAVSGVSVYRLEQSK